MKLHLHLVAASLWLLAGCGTTEPPRIPYAGDPAAVQAAFAECRQQATMAASAAQDVGERMATERSLERECMERRGYVRR